MVTKSYEVRSEEELVGNLLLVVTTEIFSSDESALKYLWIAAQEYSNLTSSEVIEKDYSKKCKNFSFKKSNIGAFRDKLNDILFKVKSYGQTLEESPAGALIYIKELLLKKIDTDADSNLLLLEDDFSTYSVFISSKSCSVIFSWNDVI